jgi:adenosylmethionine-8-amino-7-oxononanoate aminotransferase
MTVELADAMPSRPGVAQSLPNTFFRISFPLPRDEAFWRPENHRVADPMSIRPRSCLEVVPRAIQPRTESRKGAETAPCWLAPHSGFGPGLYCALGFFHNTGFPRSRIVVMEHSYHGDTIGAMSVGERGVFNAAYEPLLFGVDTIPFPAAGREQDALDAFEHLCRGRKVAALLVEPLVLGAGGMKMYRPHLLTELQRIAKHYGSLLIADEVMTGWGRTGTLFACEQTGITPDILCVSKGITGGALPLAATLCSPEIFDAHLSSDRSRTFFHSSSYTANPIACAAALANLTVWQNERFESASKHWSTCTAKD